jgi:lysozyme
MKRCVNFAGLVLIQDAEGLRLEAYKDPAGIWTIGYGHTGGVHAGDTCTEQEAVYLLYQDLASAEAWVTARCGGMSDNQFAAMVSLCFNIGNSAFLTSSVRRHHNDLAFTLAADAFLLWDKAHVDGRLIVLPGLLARRQRERALYLSSNQGAK